MRAIRSAILNDPAVQRSLEAAHLSEPSQDATKEILWSAASFLSTELEPMLLVPKLEQVFSTQFASCSLLMISLQLLTAPKFAETRAGALQIGVVGNEATLAFIRRQSGRPKRTIDLILLFRPFSVAGRQVFYYRY